MSTDENNNAEPTLNQLDFLQLISNALKAGTIDAAKARQLRAELGVLESSFTKKQISKEDKKKKRKEQKKARKITAKQGFKGQKMTKGKASGRGR